MQCANPAHHVEGIPKNFPERNGGVCFMRGAQASTITRDWLNELAANPGPGGTDQMPLRRVLEAPRAFVRSAVARPVPVPEGVDLRERRAALAFASDLPARRPAAGRERVGHVRLRAVTGARGV